MKKQNKISGQSTEISREKIEKDVEHMSVAMGVSEIVERYGSANAEFLKGYSGIDHTTGQRMAKGLADVAKHKINTDPIEAVKNIKQQAGFSAEIATTSRDNAKAIIENKNHRTWRSDDLPEFGRNHNVVDRVQVLNGQVVEGSQAQMKFVGNRNQLFENIAKEDGKFARYRGVNLELPSEQYQGAQEYCLEQAKKLRAQAQFAKPDAAAKLLTKADNYEQLADRVKDSGLTTEQAIFYRENPVLATSLDILSTSHDAGVTAAKYGGAIGGSISIVRNCFRCLQGEQGIDEAALSMVKDTSVGVAIGYGTGFTGSAIKGFLEQSSSESMRGLSRTNAPAMVVNVCISMAGSIKRFVNDEITESELLAEVGEKGAGMISGAMMAAVGQLAIPIPIVGAALGSMIGYTISSLFYQTALDAAKGAENSARNLKRIQDIEQKARANIAVEREGLDKFLANELPVLHENISVFNNLLISKNIANCDDFAMAINEFANLLGRNLEFSNLSEFEDFMLSEEVLRF